MRPESMKTPAQVATVPLPRPLFRGGRRACIALVGLAGGGKSTLFRAVSATSVRSGALAGTRRAYDECAVQIGLDEARVVDLPSVRSLRDPEPADQAALKYLLWGDERPPVSAHEPQGPPAPFAPPDVIVQVADATALARHLELTLELLQLGRPLVVALNRMDEAREKGLHVGSRVLSRSLGVPVVPIVAARGQGVPALFTAALEAARRGAVPLPFAQRPHLTAALRPLFAALRGPEIGRAFRVPLHLLVGRVAEGDRYFIDELRQHFPQPAAEVMRLRAAADRAALRPLREELHAERHHRAAILAEAAARPAGVRERRNWRYWLDELFLHPRWGLVGSAAVFAAVLFVVFDVSARIDAATSARLVEWVSAWQPRTTAGVIGRAVADGLIGLVGIVVPYMIPLVLLLIVLEQAGIMARIAFAVDRGFHRLGLHGNVAVPFLLGLGCNVPALAAIGASTRGRERVVASLLVTFVPCSARSAIILALAGKYLGAAGVLAIFLIAMIVIAVLAQVLRRWYPRIGPGQIQEIPPYALPRWRPLLKETWLRTRDILTVVLPLLVGGSVVLGLLNHFGADRVLNTLLVPVTGWWLGLPAVLGVPILFGVLRKELSLLMVFQALGSFEIDRYLGTPQIVTFLLFLTFYVPCISTFAVMLKTIGRRQALLSVSLSFAVALLVSAAARLALEAMALLGT
jgi:ferrous iron transport protein B